MFSIDFDRLFLPIKLILLKLILLLKATIVSAILSPLSKLKFRIYLLELLPLVLLSLIFLMFKSSPFSIHLFGVIVIFVGLGFAHTYKQRPEIVQGVCSVRLPFSWLPLIFIVVLPLVRLGLEKFTTDMSSFALFMQLAIVLGFRLGQVLACAWVFYRAKCRG